MHVDVLRAINIQINSEFTAWYQYLAEAFYRLDPASEDTYPSRQVIRLPGSENAKMSIKWLWEALTEHPASKKVIMIASRTLHFPARSLPSIARRSRRVILGMRRSVWIRGWIDRSPRQMCRECSSRRAQDHPLGGVPRLLIGQIGR